MANRKDLENSVEQLEKDINSGKNKSKKTIIKYLLNITLVLIVTVLAVVFTFYGSVDQILDILAKCDWRWLLAIVGIMGFAMFVRAFILYCFARLFTKNYGFHQALAVDQIGQFYNAVTPSSTGGEIMQAYTYKKQGLHISSAISALAMYSIVYQAVLILYNLLAFIFKFDLIMGIGNVEFNLGFNKIYIHISVLTIGGFILNVSVILLVFLMAYWRGFHNFIMGPIIGFLGKLRIIKNVDKTREDLRVQVENFKIEFRRLLTNIPFTLLIAISFAIYMTARFSIPYFCGLALGSEHTSATYFWDSVFLGNFHQMVSGLIPIPGAAGVSEFFFQALFYNNIEPAEGFFYVSTGSDPKLDSLSLTKAALIVWRSITFIVPIIVAGITTAFYKTGGKRLSDMAREDIPNRETYIELKRQTYVMRKEDLDELINTTRLNRASILEKIKESTKKSRNKTVDKSNNNSNKKDHTSYKTLNIDEEED